jgi:transcription termination factor Rho
MLPKGSRMSIGIERHGIARRADEGAVILRRPAPNGRVGTTVEVSAAIAERFRLWTGDVVEGGRAPIGQPFGDEEPAFARDEFEQFDEPARARGEVVPEWLFTKLFPSEMLLSVERVNGLPAEQALDRPSARGKRGSHERAAPDRRVSLATSPSDLSGRALDFAAPFALGYAGILYGPHGAGLTRALQAALLGIGANAPEAARVVLLMRPRGEEITDWRRRFPDVDVVVAPTPAAGATAEQTMEMADLVLACCQRQTELGRHVVLAVDSLTALWGAMLEAEEADAQQEADLAWARRRVREWMQCAGSFSAEGLFGSGLGGSLTILGTVWHQGVDPEAEEEGEVHPHLRLMEHILHDTNWRVPLSGELARSRLFPAVEPAHAHSREAERLLGEVSFSAWTAARAGLSDETPIRRHLRLMEALEATADEDALLAHLGSGVRQSSSAIRQWLGAGPDV